MEAVYHAYTDFLAAVGEHSEKTIEEYYRERAVLSYKYESALGSLIWSRIFCMTKNGYMGMGSCTFGTGQCCVRLLGGEYTTRDMSQVGWLLSAHRRMLHSLYDEWGDTGASAF